MPIDMIAVMQTARTQRHAAEPPLDLQAATRIARALATFADPTRLRILSLIDASRNGEVTVREITDALEIRQPNASHHLKLMVEDGVLRREVHGRNSLYSIHPDHAERIRELLR